MSDKREVSDNDLSIIMTSALKSAQWLAVAATQNGGFGLRERYLEAMHNAMVAAEQARQIAGRPTIQEIDDDEDQP